MKSLRILIFPVLAFIIGGFTLADANRTAKRSGMVEELPTAIPYEQLVENGPPENRHVKITDCFFAKNDFACAVNEDRDAWHYVLMPIYPTNDQQAENEAKFDLVAYIHVSNPDELADYLAKNEVIGCVWDDYRGTQYFDALLRDIHPDLEAGSYRVVFPGDELPTLKQARQEMITGAAFILFGVCFLFWRVWKWRRAHQRNENQEWFAKDVPSQSRQSQSFDQSLTQFERPSETMASLRSWIVWISVPAFTVAGCFYFLSEIEIISEEVGLWGMSVGVLIGFASGGFLIWSYRYFTEQAYESRSTESLSRSARKFFEQETPRLESLGFVYLGDISVIESISASVRLFLSECGECVATLESGLGQTAYNFLSVASDGTLLHTVSLDLERPIDTPLPSRCQWAATKDITLAFRQHLELIVSQVSITEAPCLRISPKYVTGVMDYAHWISGWSNIERGSAKKGVPLLPRAEQIVQQEQDRLMFAWQASPNGVVFANDRLEALRIAQANYAARSSAYAEQSAEQDALHPVGSEIFG